MNTRNAILELAREYKIEGTGNINQHKNDLIVLMKHFPFMYGPRESCHKSAGRRQLVWSTLAEVFKCNENQVQRRWHLLQENFRRLKASRDKQASTLGSDNRYSFVAADHPLLQQLSYLEDIASNDELQDEEGDSLIVEETKIQDMEVPNSDFEYVDSKVEQTSKCNEKITVKDLGDNDNLFPDVNDVEDLLFAKLIAHELRKITCPIKRLRVQQEILRIIERYANNENMEVEVEVEDV